MPLPPDARKVSGAGGGVKRALAAPRAGRSLATRSRVG